MSDFVGAGAQSVVLGSNILRASTAGPVALSLLSRALGVSREARISLIRNSMEADFHHGQQGAASI